MFSAKTGQRWSLQYIFVLLCETFTFTARVVALCAYRYSDGAALKENVTFRKPRRVRRPLELRKTAAGSRTRAHLVPFEVPPTAPHGGPHGGLWGPPWGAVGVNGADRPR